MLRKVEKCCEMLSYFARVAKVIKLWKKNNVQNDTGKNISWRNRANFETKFFPAKKSERPCGQKGLQMQIEDLNIIIIDKK